MFAVSTRFLDGYQAQLKRDFYHKRRVGVLGGMGSSLFVHSLEKRTRKSHRAYVGRRWRQATRHLPWHKVELTTRYLFGLAQLNNVSDPAKLKSLGYTWRRTWLRDMAIFRNGACENNRSVTIFPKSIHMRAMVSPLTPPFEWKKREGQMLCSLCCKWHMGLSSKSQ